MIEPDRDHFLYAACRLAAKDRNGLADPEDIAIELGIGLYEVTELVRRLSGLVRLGFRSRWKAAAPLRTGARTGRSRPACADSNGG